MARPPKPPPTEFARLVVFHMALGTQPGPRRYKWTTKSLAQALNCKERTIRNWKSGGSAPLDTAALERIFFGPVPDGIDPNQQERDALRTALEASRSGSDSKTHERSDLFDHKPPALDIYQIDNLAIDDRIVVDFVECGTGVPAVHVPANRLVWLDADTRLLDDSGSYPGTTRFCPESRAACEALAVDRAVFWPRSFRVVGSGPSAHWTTQLYVVTDMPYPSGVAYPGHVGFKLSGFLGIDGQAAFVGPNGDVNKRSRLEIGEGLGCAAAICIVASHNGQSIARSRYFIMVRKDDFLPDSV